MIPTCYFDSETLGLYGPAVIFQYAFDEDQPTMHNVWTTKAGQTRALIQEIVNSRVIAHNLTFDWQKVQSLYNALLAFHNDEYPIDDVDRFALSNYDNRSRFCLKPKQAVCTLLLCQKSIGGAALAMKEIRVRKIPADAAPWLCDILNRVTDLPDLMFANRKTERNAWNLGESKDGEGWADIVLKFAPSNGLKNIARLVLGEEDTQKIGQDFQLPSHPVEEGFAPYAVLLNEGDWFYTPKPKSGQKPMALPLWPRLLHEHSKFWTTHPDAVRYALDDVDLLRKLYKHLGSPETDFDGELACQVASVRMAGFSIDRDKLRAARTESVEHNEMAQVNVDSPKQVRKFIADALDPLEAHVVADGCDQKKLNRIVHTFTLTEEEECWCDGDDPGCQRCGGSGVVGPGPMPVAKRAEHILDIRNHRKRLQVYNKLAKSKGAFPSFKVIGAKSGRMAGADGLNYHGIDKSASIRSLFDLTGHDEGWVVCGGDFDSQELAIMAATMNDDALDHDIRTGKSLHAVFAESASGIPYDQIMANKSKDGPEAEWYGKAKSCVYALSYGAAAFKVSEVIGCSETEAEQIILKFFEKYVHMLQTRKQITKSLSCIHREEEGGLSVGNPEKTYVESCFGFRRAFNVEYQVIGAIIKAMKQWRYDTGSHQRNSHPGAPWDDNVECLTFNPSRKVVRKEAKGEQTVKSCVMSALYGSAFSVQNKIIRAALNHQIQSAGRTITLRVQAGIWKLQPVGINPFQIKLMSVHDEIITTSPPDMVEPIAAVVREEVTKLNDTIPLLGLGWARDVGSWYGVKSTKQVEQMGWGG